jgi:hypothetical protein
VCRHGPLSAAAPPRIRDDFLIVAPQLPRQGDRWLEQAAAVVELVRGVWATHGGDPARTYLTGFSYGGNGVLDLGGARPGFWAALWPVDPTRVPPTTPDSPVRFAAGPLARPLREGFIRSLRLADRAGESEGVYEDHGADHVGTARVAYGADDGYEWLLRHRLDGGANATHGADA